MPTPQGCRDPPVCVSRSDVSQHEFGRAQTMFKNALIHLRRQLLVGGSLTALAMACLGGAGAFAADPDMAVDKISTASPIKHVIIIVGENRGFDHIFATYVRKNRNERVLNLLSQGIMEPSCYAFFDTSSAVCLLSSPCILPDRIQSGLFLNAHHHRSLRQQLEVV